MVISSSKSGRGRLITKQSSFHDLVDSVSDMLMDCNSDGDDETPVCAY